MAIYRDNSKRVQPLSSGTGGKAEKAAAAALAPAQQTVEKVVYRPVRRKLPDTRGAITHKFSIGGHEGYITVGMYDDGAPGEIFITMAKDPPAARIGRPSTSAMAPAVRKICSKRRWTRRTAL